MNLLQIGINAYGGGASLQGCVNDILNFGEKSKLMLPPAVATYRLFDKDATVKNTRKLFDEMVKASMFSTKGCETFTLDCHIPVFGTRDVHQGS